MTPEQPLLAVRQRFVSDWQRPRYHFLPPSNWMNDPNGLIHWKGTYHLFYQHNPNDPLWGDMHWGHAASEDLIRWRDLPVAIAPTPGGPDEAGVFSGCAFDFNGQPTIFYTGTRGARHEIQTQCMAFSSDDLLTVTKYEDNPVLSDLPTVAKQTRDFRDPFVWREGDTWYMVVGSRIQDVGGAVFLYRSPNLIDWEYLDPLLVDTHHVHTGGVWECPNFFPLGDRWVLIISAHTGTSTGDVIYFVGTFENHRFTPEVTGVVDYGTLYAPLTFVDSSKRRLLMGWLRESRSPDEQRRAGWSGVQSIPRILSLDDQHRLKMSPVPELLPLRGQHHHYGETALSAETLLDVSGLALDIAAAFEPGADGTCGLTLACSADGTERTEIVFDAAAGSLSVRRTGAQPADIQQAPHTLAAGELLTLRILLDGSVTEIIANERTSLTNRSYPSQSEHNRVRLFGSKARLQSLDVWAMPSIW